MLSRLQQRVARIVTALPTAEGFALAGGAALVLAEVRGDGLEVTVNHANRGFARFTVTGEDGEATELDLGVDARIRPAETGPLGPMLALEELAADKMLALFGRAQARDFLDVAALGLGPWPPCRRG